MSRSSSPSGQPADRSLPASRGRVVIVEDAPVVAQSLRILLEARDFSVVTAATREQASRAFLEGPVVLAVIDEVLPDGRGSELVPGLRKLHPGARIFSITAIDQASEVARISQYGIDGIFTKPIDSMAFLRRLDDLLVNASQGERAAPGPSRSPVRTGRATGDSSGGPPPLFLPGFPAESEPFARFLWKLSRVIEFRSTLTLCGAPGAAYATLARDIHAASSLSTAPYLECSGAVPTRAEVLRLRRSRRAGNEPLTLALIRPHGFDDEDRARLGELLAPGDEPFPLRVILGISQEAMEALESDGSVLGFRFSMLVLRVPRLAELKEDLGELARAILEESPIRDRGTSIEPLAVSDLAQHGWDGDHAELAAVLHRAQSRAVGTILRRSEIAEAVRAQLLLGGR